MSTAVRASAFTEPERPMNLQIRFVTLGGSFVDVIGPGEHLNALPGAVGSLRASVVVADEAQDRVADLAEGQVAVVFLSVGGVTAGVGGEGQLEVSAQDVDAGLAEAVVGGVVGEASQGVNAAELDGWGVGSEFVDGLGEALGVQARVFAVGAGFVDALAAVGDDQGNESTCAGHDAEGELDQVKECL